MSWSFLFKFACGVMLALGAMQIVGGLLTSYIYHDYIYGALSGFTGVFLFALGFTLALQILSSEQKEKEEKVNGV